VLRRVRVTMALGEVATVASPQTIKIYVRHRARQRLDPQSNWQPLSIEEVVQLFAKAPFTWGLAGGYAVEQFLGRSTREHSDIDVVVYRDAQLQAQSWLSTWQLYAADPPGALRPWIDNEYLPYGIHDIWGHRLQVQLLYKARGCRPKDNHDFQACLPQLSADAKQWLRNTLLLVYPAGHPWLEDLS